MLFRSLACDLVAASNAENLSKLARDRTDVVFNRFVAPTSAFATNPDLDFSHDRLEQAVGGRVRASFGVDATDAAQRLLGNAIGANMLLVGYAWQKGLVPLGRDSIEAAIRLNGTQVDLNLNAFALGRIAAADPDRLAEALAPATPPARLLQTLDGLIEDRARRLTDYQNAACAERYRALIDRVRRAEAALGAGDALTRTVARSYAKLLAYKDEYEVGRLYTEGLRHHLEDQFEGNYRLRFHLAPPLLAKRDKATGRYGKMTFGPWMLGIFRLLAWLKFLRGTPFDIFGKSRHRRFERRLIADYEALVAELLTTLSAANLTEAVELAGMAEKIRGFDVVKEASAESVGREMEQHRATPEKQAA